MAEKRDVEEENLRAWEFIGIGERGARGAKDETV
jgi:hypothetical protein